MPQHRFFVPISFLNHFWVVRDTQKLVFHPVKYFVPYFGSAIKQLIRVFWFFQEFRKALKVAYAEAISTSSIIISNLSSLRSKSRTGLNESKMLSLSTFKLIQNFKDYQNLKGFQLELKHAAFYLISSLSDYLLPFDFVIRRRVPQRVLQIWGVGTANTMLEFFLNCLPSLKRESHSF